MKQWFEKHKECVRRSARTFVQAAVGVFVAGLTSGGFELTEWKTWIATLVGSSLAAGVAAVMNLNEKKEVL